MEKNMKPKSENSSDLKSRADHIISRLSLKEKIGQMMMVGFYGEEITPELEEMISEYRPGGIIYFARNLKNPRQVFKLSRNLQELSCNTIGLPLLIAADEEGGIVTRVPGMTHYPGAMSWGAADDTKALKEMAAAKARELRYLGVNFNLAPVLDVNNNPQNPIIGVRAAGGDPEKVAELGRVYIEGLQEKEIAACGKHFPGHGDTEVDSHHDLPVIEHDRERLERVELAPFRAAIEAGVESIMMAHIAFPALTGSRKEPATLSSKVVYELLREELNFSGIIITDCLEMEGIRGVTGTAEGAVRAVAAGCDIALISHSRSLQIKAFKKLEEAVKEGRISRKRIDRSVRRIIQLKLKISQGDFMDSFAAEKSFSQEKFTSLKNRGKRAAEKIARHAITRLPGSRRYLPFNPDELPQLWLIDMRAEEGKTAVESGQRNREFEDLDTDIEILARKLAENDFDPRILRSPGQKKIDELVFSARKNLSEEGKKLPGAVVFMEELQEEPGWFNPLVFMAESKMPAVFVIQRSPYGLDKLKQAEVLITYDSSPMHISSIFEILTGEDEPAGSLPVSLPGKD